MSGPGKKTHTAGLLARMTSSGIEVQDGDLLINTGTDTAAVDASTASAFGTANITEAADAESATSSVASARAVATTATATAAAAAAEAGATGGMLPAKRAKLNIAKADDLNAKVWEDRLYQEIIVKHNGRRHVDVSESQSIRNNLQRALDLRRSYESLYDEPETDVAFPLAQRLGDRAAVGADRPSAAPSGALVELVNGVLTVTMKVGGTCVLRAPDHKTYAEYVEDMKWLIGVSRDGPTNTLAYHRCKALNSLYDLHVHLNRSHERKQLNGNGTDFFQSCKVDNHIHLSGAFNGRMLLRYIREKFVSDRDVIVLERPNGKRVTLGQVALGLVSRTGIEREETTYVRKEVAAKAARMIDHDQMETCADTACYQRFDVFNDRFSPFANPDLRVIFMKTKNLVGGLYYAELTKRLISDLESQGTNACAEYRISVYGKSPREWHDLASWFVRYGLQSPQVRWLAQMPRIYRVHRTCGSIANFGEILDNFFRPLFDVTLHPERDPALSRLLQQFVGFDSVDNEAGVEGDYALCEKTPPEAWTSTEEPPYEYYMYYMWANIRNLNALRQRCGLNTFAFRPHCGEAGPSSHLAAGFLCADRINHGIVLGESIVLQYLYYLAQVPISVSPMSNNALFARYNTNPFPKFFARGLNVTLSTDDPLQFHMTSEPLHEEYSMAAQAWRLGMVDLSEIARNSVRHSGFSREFKRKCLGTAYSPVNESGNDMSRSNVPNMRIAFRVKTWLAEDAYLRH